MNKLPLTIVLLVVMSLFASADLYINKIEIATQANQSTSNQSDKPEVIEVESTTSRLLKLNQIIQNYQIEQQFQVETIFKKIRLSSTEDLVAYQSKFRKIDLSDEFVAYEIIHESAQPELTYLNTKLAIIAQINHSTETINETDSFAEKSLFFNDSSEKETAFLLTQTKKGTFGFEYKKENPETYQNIIKIIDTLNTDY